jgi:hypothetical protein
MRIARWGRDDWKIVESNKDIEADKHKRPRMRWGEGEGKDTFVLSSGPHAREGGEGEWKGGERGRSSQQKEPDRQFTGSEGARARNVHTREREG